MERLKTHLLEASRWDPSQRPCVCEINAGRFFTTSIFFATAGSNMPYYYLLASFGEPLPLLKQYNALPPDLYWVRIMDEGDMLFKDV